MFKKFGIGKLLSACCYKEMHDTCSLSYKLYSLSMDSWKDTNSNFIFIYVEDYGQLGLKTSLSSRHLWSFF